MFLTLGFVSCATLLLNFILIFATGKWLDLIVFRSHAIGVIISFVETTLIAFQALKAYMSPPRALFSCESQENGFDFAVSTRASLITARTTNLGVEM